MQNLPAVPSDTRVGLTNNNCLDDMRCPECGSEGPFVLRGTAEFDFTDEGSGDYNTVEWESHSDCSCSECKFDGQVLDFNVSTQLVPPNCAVVSIEDADRARVAGADVAVIDLILRRLVDFKQSLADEDPATQRNVIASALRVAVDGPVAMLVHVAQTYGRDADDKLLDTFRLLPHFRYVARRVQRRILALQDQAKQRTTREHSSGVADG